jgi:hypothetical protein
MDEREIEAVAEALWGNNRLDGKPNTYPYDHLMGLTRADLRRLALAAIAALDHVRDARGDDEGPRQDSLSDQMQTVEDLATRAGCYDALDWMRRAWAARPLRSPQDDDEVQRLRAINAELVEAHNTLLVEAARSPQDEDHEPTSKHKRDGR